MQNQSVAVLVSGSNFLIRQGITALVDSLPHCQGEESLSNSPYDAIISAKNKPRLLIFEFEKPDRDFWSEIDNVLSRTQTEVLLIAGTVEKDTMQRLVNKGVKGIVTKKCSKEEITNAIKTTSTGERFLCSKVLDVLINQESAIKKKVPANEVLSPREKEVLTLITQGNTTIEIADKLHVSIHTINSHRKNMLKKFGLKSPIELIVFALENNLVEK